MSSYRFCRTDDIGLLVDALNRCWAPYAADEPPESPATFKRAIRDLQVWCSSCMVAFSGPDPVGVLIGAKRPTETLVHRIAVHPDHRRQGHGRHLLESLSAKLAILGPPRIVAEVPERLAPACGLFDACGFAGGMVYTDYVRDGDAVHAPGADEVSDRDAGTFMMPVTVDDLAANGLFDEASRQVCWMRSAERLGAIKADVGGLALASDAGIEAYVLYRPHERHAEVVAMRSLVDDDGWRLRRLLDRLRASGLETFGLAKAHPAEVPPPWLEAMGFRPVARHRRYEAQARPA